MIDALYIGATGMQAQQTNVETIANNLANANTPGYKKSRVSFADMMAHEASRSTLPVATSADSLLLNGAPRLGSGVAISTLAKMFDLGDMKKTDSPWDVAIQGDGFLEVALPDGSRAYTRGGTLKVNRDGQLATHSGFTLRPGIQVPDNAQAVTIRSDGSVRVQLPGETAPVEVGQLELVRFTGTNQLTVQGDNLYRANEATGEPIAARPGEDSTGTLIQGTLEASNVKMVDEMVGLMLAQRAYEASVKVVQASDEMLGMINNLRK